MPAELRALEVGPARVPDLVSETLAALVDVTGRAEDTEAAPVAAGVAAGLAGRESGTPALLQKLCANAIVSVILVTVVSSENVSCNLLCWSAALHAVVMQVWTPERKPVALQMQAASVIAHPVLPIAPRAHVVCDG